LIEISVNPVVSIGPISIRWYGVMVTLAILVLVLWMLKEVRRGANLSYETILTAAIVGIPSGIVISKLLHVVDRWGDYIQKPGEIIGAGGLTIYGAILGAALGIWIYSKFSRKFQFGYFADRAALGLILAQAVGRVGCTINGCCYGIETSLPWGVVYSHPDSFAPLGIVIHPTQPYEIIYLLIVFAVLYSIRWRFKPDGSLFLIYLSLYSLWRIGIDFIRDGTPFLFGLHQAQVIGIIVLAIAVPILAYRTRWVKKGER
jgi:phosphatidylglycerol:prolipoprotein diacylglycerol transferase